MTRLKSRANKCGIPFNLQIEDFFIPDYCPILGIKLSDRPDSRATIDRIVPELGYVKGNVLVISDLANRIKTNATPSEILAVGNFYFNLHTKKESE